MPGRLIDADAIGIDMANPEIFECKEYADGWNSAIKIIQNSPTVDAVPVVRCKDCVFWDNGDCYRLELSRPEDFCSYGKRKERS